MNMGNGDTILLVKLLWRGSCFAIHPSDSLDHAPGGAHSHRIPHQQCVKDL